MGATGQASATELAAGAARALAVKERIVYGLPGFAEVDAQRYGAISVTGLHGIGRLLHVGIHLAQIWIGRPAEHLLSCFIVRRQFGVPIDAQAGPGRIFEEGFLGLEQYGRIDQAASTNANAANYGHVAEDMLGEIAFQPQRR